MFSYYETLFTYTGLGEYPSHMLPLLKFHTCPELIHVRTELKLCFKQ